MDYGIKSKLHFTVCAWPQEAIDVVVSYITVLCCHSQPGHRATDLHELEEALGPGDLVAHRVASFEGALNVDITETNLVPYPRIHFMLSSHAFRGCQEAVRQILGCSQWQDWFGQQVLPHIIPGSAFEGRAIYVAIITPFP